MSQTPHNLEKCLPSSQQIARRAYEIFLDRGCRPGRDKDDWIQAEYELMQLPIHAIATLPALQSAKVTKQKTAKALQPSALVSIVQGALLFGANVIR